MRFQVSQVFLTIFLFFIGSSALANNACRNTFIDFSISPWNYDTQLPKLTPEKLLTGEFRSDLEEYVGSLKVTAQRGPFIGKLPIGPRGGLVRTTIAPEAIRLTIKSGNFKVVDLYAWRVAPGNSLMIDGLRIRNPLTEDTETNFRANQDYKGVSLQEFKFLTSQLSEAAKKSGFKSIETDAPSTYAVALLYRRMLSYQPKHETALGYTKMIDKYFTYAAKKAPNHLRTKTLEGFQMLMNQYPSAEQYAMYDRYQKTGAIDARMTILREGSENYAVVFKKEDGKDFLAFIDNMDPGKGLMTWWDVYYEMPLIRKI